MPGESGMDDKANTAAKELFGNVAEYLQGELLGASLWGLRRHPDAFSKKHSCDDRSFD